MAEARTRLIGRERELEAVRRALAAARAGRTAAVVLEGEAGIGKTVLLDEALAAEAGVLLLQPPPDELSWSRPFGALADALDIQLDDVGGPNLPADALNESPVARYATVERIVAELEELASTEPVALVLDDLHVAEPSTALVLPTLLRRLAGMPFALVVALRPATGGPDIARAVDQLTGAGTGADLVTLDRLGDDDVRALVAARLGGRDPGARLLRQANGADGNPLFVLELIDGLLAEDAIDTDAELVADHLPATFRATVARRLRTLPDDTVAALWAASVLGASFALDDLATVLDVAPLDALQRVRPAIDEGLLDDRGGQLGFRHALVGDAIQQALPPDVQRTLHQQVGRALLRAGRPVAVAARHLAVGAGPGDEEAIAALHEAAREATASAPALAVAHLHRALELAGPALDARTIELTCDLLLALVWAGRPAEAVARARELLDATGESAPAAAHLGLARALLLQGHVAGCVTEIESAAAGVDPDAGRAGLLVEAAMGRLLIGDIATASDHARTALEIGERIGDPLSVSGALCTLGFVDLVRGDYPAAVASTAKAAEAPGAGDHPRHPWLFHGMALTSVDQLDEATRVLLEGRNQASAAGTVWSLPMYHVALAQRHFAYGAWDDAVAECAAAVTHGQELGTRLGAVWPLAIQALVFVHRDQLAATADVLALAERELAEVGPQFGEAWTRCARAMLLEAEQRPADGLEALVPMWQRGQIVGMVSELQLLGPVLVRLALAVDDRTLASAVTADVEAAAAKARSAGFVGNAGRCRGLLEDDPDVLVDAATTLGTTQRVDRWFAAHEAAVSLARHGRPDEAAPLVDRAFDGFASLDAVRSAAQADAELRAVGIRRGRRGPRQRPTHGQGSLTDTERNVVRLAQEGLTNAGIAERLYISRRTVETHLSHVYAKLGVDSRRALLDLR